MAKVLDGVPVFECDASARTDGAIMAVAHDEFQGMGLSGVREFLDEGAVVVDARVMFEGEWANMGKFHHKTL